VRNGKTGAEEDTADLKTSFFLTSWKWRTLAQISTLKGASAYYARFFAKIITVVISVS